MPSPFFCFFNGIHVWLDFSSFPNSTIFEEFDKSWKQNQQSIILDFLINVFVFSFHVFPFFHQWISTIDSFVDLPLGLAAVPPIRVRICPSSKMWLPVQTKQMRTWTKHNEIRDKCLKERSHQCLRTQCDDVFSRTNAVQWPFPEDARHAGQIEEQRKALKKERKEKRRGNQKKNIVGTKWNTWQGMKKTEETQIWNNSKWKIKKWKTGKWTKRENEKSKKNGKCKKWKM